MANNAAIIPIKGDSADVEKTLKEIQQSFKTFGSAVKATAAIAVAAFSIDKLKSFSDEVLGLAGIQEEAEAKLDAVLKSTGERAGFTADQLKQMASDLQGVTKFGDEGTIAVQAFLLTLENVRGDQFKQVLPLAADLATVLGTDLKGAATTVGQALNDPIRGITRLVRAGITFSEQESVLIEKLQTTGDVAGAQQVILDKLSASYSGAAAAAAGTLGGQLTQLGNAWGDVKELMGQAIGPLIELALPAFEELVSVAGTVVAAFRDELVPEVSGSLGALIETVQPIVEALQDLFVAFYAQIESSTATATGETLPSFGESIKSMVEFATPILETIGDMFSIVFVSSAVAIEHWEDIATVAINSFLLAAVQAFNSTIHFLGTTIPEALDYFSRNWKEIFVDIGEITKTILSNIGSNLMAFFEAVSSWLSGEGFNFKWTGLTEGFESAIKELPKFSERIPSELEMSLAQSIEEAGKNVGDAFVDQFSKRLQRTDELKKKFFAPDKGPGVDLTPDTSKFQKLNETASAAGAREKLQKETDKTKQEADKANAVSSIAGGFEGLADLNKRISSAAGKSPAVEAMEKNTKQQEQFQRENVKLMQEQTTAIKELKPKPNEPKQSTAATYT